MAGGAACVGQKQARGLQLTDVNLLVPQVQGRWRQEHGDLGGCEAQQDDAGSTA